MIAYKGFHKDLNCTMGKGDFHFVPGKWYSEENAKCASTGFHATDNPLDVLSYYRGPDDRYFIVNLRGNVDEDGVNSRIAAPEIMLVKELTKDDLYRQGVIWISKHQKAPWAAVVEEVQEEEEQLPGQMNVGDYEGVVPDAQYEEVTEDAGTDVNTIAGMPEGSGATGDALESGTDAGASGETEDADTACQYDESTGAAESGGRETDPCTVEEDIWMEVRAAHQSLTQYLTVWSDKESLMETDVMESIRLKAISLAAGIEKIMILRAGNNE